MMLKLLFTSWWMLMNYFISILLYPSKSLRDILTTKDCFFGGQIILHALPHRCVANDTSWVYAFCLLPCYAQCHILVWYISHVFCIMWIGVCLQFQSGCSRPKRSHLSGSRTHTPDGIPTPNGSKSNWDFLPGRSPTVGRTYFLVNRIGARRRAWNLWPHG